MKCCADFNTSNVVVYPANSRVASGNSSNFNTSNVVVYHFLNNLSGGHISISIHLMLLFIDKGNPIAVYVLGFQYI